MITTATARAMDRRRTGCMPEHYDSGPGGVRRYREAVTVLRVALAQLNLVVGDLAGNVATMRRRARAGGVGRRRPGGLPRAGGEQLSARGPAAEAPLHRRQPSGARRPRGRHPGLRRRRRLRRPRRCGPLQRGGRVRARRGAGHLPEAAVAELLRLRRGAVLRAGRRGAPGCSRSAAWPVGVAICEDAWEDHGPVPALCAAGAGVVVVINGSPYYDGKVERRERVIGALAATVATPIAYLNLVGGQDELVFDGESAVYDADGTVSARALGVRPGPPGRRCRGRRAGPDRDLSCRSPMRPRLAGRCRPHRPPTRLDRLEEVWEALVLGTRDYVTKNGFTEAVIGLSGGVDSSIVAALAVDALGADKRARRAHAVALLQRPLAQRRPDAEREPRHRSSGDPDRGRPSRLHRHAGRLVRRARARPDRGEPPVAHPGRPADGAVQQVRVDGADHRQQERERRGLLHALRRHRRRVRRHQGRAQAAGLRAVPGSQRQGRARAHPRAHPHQAAVGRAATRPARRSEPPALRGARPDPARPTSRTTARRARSSPTVTTPTSSPASPGSSTSPSTSAARARPGPESRPRPSARTAACRSPTATGATTRAEQHAVDGGIAVAARSAPAAPAPGSGSQYVRGLR